MITTISNSNLTAQIKHLGAELISLKNQQNQEYIWEGNPAFWGKHSPVLFPIVGTLKNNSYYYNDIEYHLSRHGFARDMEFIVLEKSETAVVFSLTATTESLKNYPFDFALEIGYTLEQNKLIITYRIRNNSDKNMPFSIGAHPAFALTKPFEKYALAFEHSEVLTSYELENDLLSNSTKTIEMTNHSIPLTYSLFEKDALIFKKLKSKTITILDQNTPFLRIEFNDFPNLGIWTKNKAPFLCIEPWLGYSDTTVATANILEKEGIQILETKKSFECNFSIDIL